MEQIATVHREYWFSAAHILEGHPKCGNLHGHNYKVEVHLTGPVVDGMVMDYHDMDAIIKPLIEELDHTFLFSKENRLGKVGRFLLDANLVVDAPYFPISTSEEIAKWIIQKISSSLPPSEQLAQIAVRVWETHKSSALVIKSFVNEAKTTATPGS